MAFICKSAIQRLYPNHFFCRVLNSGPQLPCPNYSRGRHWSIRDNFYTQSLVKLFTQAYSKSAYLISTTPFLRKHNKGSCHSIPLSAFCLTLVLPPVVPLMPYLPSLGSVSDKLFFNDNCILVC